MRTLFDRNPHTCEHAARETDGHVLCTLRGEVWTSCRESICGEPPQCAWEPADNSKQAVARRLEWTRTNEDGANVGNA